jgi:2'-5' RNA ligase
LRSFIAIELPESVRTALSELQNELKECRADVRWVKPEGIHLTLKFLGYVEDKDVDHIVKLIEGTCRKYKAFNLEIAGAGVFPNKRSPRVLWVGINGNETFKTLQGEIDEAMASTGFEKENRRFIPHLTLGRFRSIKGKDALMEKVESHRDIKLGSMDVSKISLMKSDLSPAGARYTTVAGIALKSDE